MMLALLLSLLPSVPPQLPGGSFEQSRSWDLGTYMSNDSAISTLDFLGEPAVGMPGNAKDYYIQSVNSSARLSFSAQLSSNYVSLHFFPEDRNGNGCPELLLIDDGTGELQVWDYSTMYGGTMLFSVPSVDLTAAVPVADYDGDGITDVYAWDTTISGPKVISGADGSTLATIPAPGGGYFSTLNFWAIDDLDGDGARDLATLFWEAADPYVLFLSGSSYSEIGRIALTLGLVGRVVAIGDVDGDGVRDIALSDAGQGRYTNQGRVAIHSGASFAELFEVWGTGQDALFGYSMAPAGDWTGDGVPDLWAAEHSGSLFLISCGDRIAIPVDVFGGTTSGFNAVKQSGDWTGDGIPELFLVDSGNNTTVHVASHNPGATPYGAQISVASGGLVSLDVDFPDAYWGSEYRVLFSLQPPQPTWFGGLYLPLASDPLLMRTLFQGDYSFMPYQLGVTGFLDPQGDAFVSFGHPGGLTPKAVGHSAYGCVLVGPPASPELTSSAFAIEFVP